jgi:hypothetical protein
MPTDEDLLKQIVALLSGGGTITVDGGGDASAANQTAGNASLTSIDGKVSTAAKQDTLETAVGVGNTSIASVDTKLGPAPAAPADAADNATTMGVVRSRLMAFNGATWDRARSGLTALSATFLGYFNTIPTALFRAAPLTRTEGQGGPFEADAKGNLRITEQAPPAFENVADASAQVHEKPATSAAFNAIPYDLGIKASSGIIKAAPGNLYRVWFTNCSATACGAFLVNKATTPASNDVAIMHVALPAWTTVLVEFKFGKRFSTGIAWAETLQANLGAASTVVGSSASLTVCAECS